jgi:hypothetical protein
MSVNNLRFVFFNFLFLASYLFAEVDFRDYVYEIERQVAEEVKQELDLRWSGDRGRMRGKLEEIGMEFVTNRYANIEDARTLILTVVEKLAQAVNAHGKIQPYLDIHPFTYKRITVAIGFQDRFGSHSDGSVSYAFNVSDLATTPSKNHIVYFSNDPFQDRNIELLEEPYEEALKLSKTPLNPKKSDYDEKIESYLTSLSEQIHKKYGLSTWGIGGKLTKGIEEIGATFKMGQKAHQAEAREMLIHVTKTLLDSINTHESLKPYLKKVPFPSNRLKLRILFEPPKSPFTNIRRVTLNDDKVTYTLEVVHPIENGEVLRDIEEFILYPESYQEALEIVEKSQPKGI